MLFIYAALTGWANWRHSCLPETHGRTDCRMWTPVNAMKPAAEAEENRQSLIDGSYLFPRKFTEHAADRRTV